MSQNRIILIEKTPKPRLNVQIHSAVDKGDTSTIQQGIQPGNKLNAHNRFGNLFLNHVIYSHIIEAVCLLLANGADPCLRDLDCNRGVRKDALELAGLHDFSEAMKELYSHSVSI